METNKRKISFVLIVFLFVFFANIFIANAEISTEDFEVKPEPCVGLDCQKEFPEWPTEILPEPVALDQNSTAWLQMVEYQISVALIERVARENYWCQVDLENEIEPCRFGGMKQSDFYLKKFKEEIEKEKQKNVESVSRVLRSSLCPEGKFYVTDFPDGTPLCSIYSDKQGAENGRYSAALNIFQHTFAIDFEFRKRGQFGFPVFAWWEDYKFTSQVDCKDTIWGAGEICQRFSTYVEAAVNHYHAEKHLFQLQELLKSLSSLPPCNVVGDVRDGGGGNVWKPVGEKGSLCNNGRNNGGVLLLNSSYTGRISGGITIYNETFEKIGSGFSRGTTNENRETFCFDKYGHQYGTQPIFVGYDVEGTLECRRVRNPSVRED